eukprot:Tbor_TRINITY_DN5471_c4_g5::TRINITY_DN5471_c4_g5_i1::g.24204::m.24204
MTHLSRAQVNHMAIKEQEQLHRQRRQEQIEEENRQKELINKQRNKYNHVNSKGYGKRSSSSNDNNNNLKNNNNNNKEEDERRDMEFALKLQAEEERLAGRKLEDTDIGRALYRNNNNNNN